MKNTFLARNSDTNWIWQKMCILMDLRMFRLIFLNILRKWKNAHILKNFELLSLKNCLVLYKKMYSLPCPLYGDKPHNSSSRIAWNIKSSSHNILKIFGSKFFYWPQFFLTPNFFGSQNFLGNINSILNNTNDININLRYSKVSIDSIIWSLG